MEPVHHAGIVGFLAQTDAVGIAIVIVLVAMSIMTWTFIVAKTILALRQRSHGKAFLDRFWNASSLNEVAQGLQEHTQRDLFSHLTWHGLQAVKHGGANAKRLEEAGGAGEFLTRSLRRVIDEETARLEIGLTALASVGSTAPFIGLFGTVWGVYHALIAISAAGQDTLDKVAGPVGEALIMTAAGLAVAVPAVLAYNAFVRYNRVVLAQLDSFAHDLFALLATGARMDDVVPLKGVA